MENQLENAAKFTEHYNQYQQRDFLGKSKMRDELNEFFHTDLLVKYSENENGFYFEHFVIILNYKDKKFNVNNHSKNGFGFWLEYNLPFIDHNDRSQYLKQNPQPNNVFKLTKNKLINLLEYQIDKYEYLKNLSESKCNIVKEKEAEINNLFPGKNYSFSNNRFKEIQIEKNGLTYIANLHDSGYISEKISIGYSSETLNQFYNLTK
jgi:hypothetical protein